MDFVAFTSKNKADQVPGRLVLRRIPDLNAEKKAEKKAGTGRGTLFELRRHLAFFTTTPRAVADTVIADKIHRHHAIMSGPRRPQGLGAGAPPIGEVQRQRGLAGARGDGVQPHPHRRRTRRRRADTSDHRQYPTQAHQRPGLGRDHGAPPHLAPSQGLTLRAGLEPAVHRGQRPTPERERLTPQQRELRDPVEWNTRAARSGGPTRPPPGPARPDPSATTQSSPSVDSGLEGSVEGRTTVAVRAGELRADGRSTIGLDAGTMDPCVNPSTASTCSATQTGSSTSSTTTS